MTWLKDAYLDVIILLFIVLFAAYPNNVLEVVLWVYTGLLLLSKILAIYMPSLQKKANKTTAPSLFYHTVYALTIGVFLFVQHYYFAGAWVIIWIISVINLNSAQKNK